MISLFSSVFSFFPFLSFPFFSFIFTNDTQCISILPPPPMGEKACEHVSNDHDGAQDMTADLPDDWKVQPDTPCQVKSFRSVCIREPCKKQNAHRNVPSKMGATYLVRWLTIESPTTFLLAFGILEI